MSDWIERFALIQWQYKGRNISPLTVFYTVDNIYKYFLNISRVGESFLGPASYNIGDLFSLLFTILEIIL